MRLCSSEDGLKAARGYTVPVINDWSLRDWSLMTGRGGATKWEGGHVRFYPYKKGGGKRFSHAEGGGGARQVLG